MPRKGAEIRFSGPVTLDAARMRDIALWCVCGVLCLVVFALDISVTAGISIGILYVPVIVIAYGIRRADAPAVVATVSTILVGLGYVAAGPIVTPLQAVVARGLSLFIVWAAVFLPYLAVPAQGRPARTHPAESDETAIDFSRIRHLSQSDAAARADIGETPEARQTPANVEERAARELLATILSLLENARPDRPDTGDHVALVKTYLDAFERLHHMLIDGGWRGIFMHPLAAAVTEIHHAPDATPFQMHGDNLWLAPRPGVALGMLLNELARHAAADGTLSAAEGHVVIVWRTEGEGDSENLILDWLEEGGESLRTLSSGGLYTEIIHEMSHRQLGGAMAFGVHQGALRFTVKMPLTALLSAAPPPQAGAGDSPVQRGAGDVAGMAGRRVLIIEDETIIATGTRACLETAGLVVVGIADNAAAAVAAAARSDAEAAILDADLDGESAGSVAAALAERNIPFVFTSGREADPALARRYPGVPYLRKPVTSGEMTSALKAALTAGAAPSRGRPRAVS